MEIPKGAVRQNLHVPAYMKKLSRHLQSEYVGGLFDAEGCVKKRQAELNISTTSKNVFGYLGEFLSRIGVTYSTYIRTRHKNPEYEIYIYGKDDLHKFARHVCFMHPSKKKRMANFLK
jgi:intein-encoded DNA endonuclease-like protein